MGPEVMGLSKLWRQVPRDPGLFIATCWKKEGPIHVLRKCFHGVAEAFVRWRKYFLALLQDWLELNTLFQIYRTITMLWSPQSARKSCKFITKSTMLPMWTTWTLPRRSLLRLKQKVIWHLIFNKYSYRHFHLHWKYICSSWARGFKESG